VRDGVAHEGNEEQVVRLKRWYCRDIDVAYEIVYLPYRRLRGVYSVQGDSDGSSYLLLGF